MTSQTELTEVEFMREVIRLLAENNKILKQNQDYIIKMAEDVRKIKSNTTGL